MLEQCWREPTAPLLCLTNYQPRRENAGGIRTNQDQPSKWVVSDSLRPHRLYSPWNSPGQNTGVGSLSLLQGIFPTQGSNPGLLHYRRILYQLSHKGSPRILEWVAYPFSRGSSHPGIRLGSPALQADSWPTELWGKPPLNHRITQNGSG